MPKPTTYKPEYDKMASKLCKLGATNSDLADFFEVTMNTITNWQSEQTTFLRACRLGKDATDGRVERSFAMRAQGFWIDTEKVFTHKVRDKDGNEEVLVTRVPTREYIPPDGGAAMNWLRFRRPKEWREQPGLINPDGAPFEFTLKLGQMNADGSRSLAEVRPSPLVALPKAGGGDVLPDGPERGAGEVLAD
jgi:hypothetical protein